MSAPKPAIVVENVSKWYGDVVAVNGVSVQVFPGITGLLGPDGAGKTTLLHLITGLAPGGPAVDRALEIVGMADAQSRRLSGYSRGMRQRIRLAAALVHDPEILILDEPLSGTDPRQRLQFYEAMSRFAGEGRTVLVSSHILEEVELLADSIVLMVSGRLAAAGDIRAIREKLDERAYHVRIVTGSPRPLAAALVQLDEVDTVNQGPDGDLVVLSRNVGVVQESIPRLARQLGARLYRVEPLDESLDSVFGYVVER